MSAQAADVSVRIRGIYTTALTELLRDEHRIVSASPPIRERFDASFPVAVDDVAIRTTDDRLGLCVTGHPDAVTVIADRLEEIGRDTFVWDAPAPRGAVFEGEVSETLGSGAVVDLGSVREASVSGFLPYDRVDGYVDEGDRYRVQIASPAPPWRDRRPSLATDLRVSSGLVELRYGERDSMSETARMADILPVDPPDGWSPRWSRSADDASLDAMADALRQVTARAETLMAAIAESDDDDLGRIVAPRAERWVLFGRESRFVLDEYRRQVETTMAGHHRIKAATEAASAAVDFVEALCEPGDEFPFGVVTEQFGPQLGDGLEIAHGKPSGRTITLGRGEVTAIDPDGSVTIEREMSGGGTYDALGIERVAGDIATTTFVEGRWWYATVYKSADGEHRGTYVNICTPVEIFPNEARYVDLHVDVVKTPGGEVKRVDDDELDDAVAAGDVSEPLAARAREVAASIQSAL